MATPGSAGAQRMPQPAALSSTGSGAAVRARGSAEQFQGMGFSSRTASTADRSTLPSWSTAGHRSQDTRTGGRDGAGAPSGDADYRRSASVSMARLSGTWERSPSEAPRDSSVARAWESMERKYTGRADSASARSSSVASTASTSSTVSARPAAGSRATLVPAPAGRLVDDDEDWGRAGGKGGLERWRASGAAHTRPVESSRPAASSGVEGEEDDIDYERSFYTMDEGTTMAADAEGGSDAPGMFVGDSRKFAEREAAVERARARGDVKLPGMNARKSVLAADQESWERNRLRTSGVGTNATLGANAGPE
ncbi:hypothetical protein EON68_04540, partial [archaeon]